MDLDRFRELVVEKAKKFVEDNPSVRISSHWEGDNNIYFKFWTKNACYRKNTHYELRIISPKNDVQDYHFVMEYHFEKRDAVQEKFKEIVKQSFSDSSKYYFKKDVESKIRFVHSLPEGVHWYSIEDAVAEKNIDSALNDLAQFVNEDEGKLVEVIHRAEGMVMTDEGKFKCLLEYFMAHLEYKQSAITNTKGYKTYIEPILSNFTETGNGGKKDWGLQKQIEKWDSYSNGQRITIAIQGYAGVKRFSGATSYLNWENTWFNVRAKWNDENARVIGFYLTSDESQSYVSDVFSVNELGLNDGNPPNDMVKTMFAKFQKLIPSDTQQGIKMIEEIKEMLIRNHNIILHGAPGTGKTYLAKEVAKAMGCTENEIGFVQFHQSYDYTDFVEGLRPAKGKDDKVDGFELKDGVFKKFCKKAIFDDIKKDIPLPKLQDTSFDVVYKSLIKDVESGQIKNYKTPRGLYPLKIKDGRLQYREKSPRTESEDNIKLLYEYFLSKEKYDLSDMTKDDYWNLISKLTSGKTSTIDYIEYGWTLQVLLDRAKIVANDSQIQDSAKVHPEKNYIFIIDEINRGEMSKIFGELFFSIDPGYRGEKGKIKTQYQNLVDDEDVFSDGFFVPKNVYIIGTMNDIDRSVESMDFAMRRRFAFIEISASKCADMLKDSENGIGEYADEAEKRMNALNEAIGSETVGLSHSYDIGPAYFLKLKGYKGDFQMLWDYHIKGLVTEYLRGMDENGEKVAALEKAYFHLETNAPKKEESESK